MSLNHIPVKDKLGADKLFKIARFKEKIKKTKPHKHEGYHELIYLSQGEGFHWIDTQRHKVSPAEIYFLKPGSLHYWQFTSIPKGYIILFRKSYFDALREANLISLLEQLSHYLVVGLPKHHNFQTIFEAITVEYQSPSSQSHQIIHGYLQVLLAKIVHLSQSNATVRTPENSLPKRFLDLINEKCPKLHLVNEYAQLLNTSPQNLNAACRKYTNKSPAAHITAQLLLEAKRYILHTEYTISEIAHLLHFNDTSYFIKFFKKHTQHTPLQFRRQHFQ